MVLRMLNDLILEEVALAGPGFAAVPVVAVEALAAMRMVVLGVVVRVVEAVSATVSMMAAALALLPVVGVLDQRFWHLLRRMTSVAEQNQLTSFFELQKVAAQAMDHH